MEITGLFFRRRNYYQKKKDKYDATFLRNGETFMQRLIKACDGKCNPISGFSAKQLSIATNNYDAQKVIMYEVGYELYKGFLQNRPVMVMKFRGSEGYEFSFNNIVFASQISHKNFLKLIGCCLETEIPILVFESVEQGTLADRIHGPHQPDYEPFLLKHRLKIAKEIANAVAYLHVGFSRTIIFRDIKPSHILLDQQYVIKLFNFSLSDSIPEGKTHIKDHVLFGSRGFIAPEYRTTFDYNEKCDVHSFGALLLELLSGQRIYDLACLAKEDGCAISDYVKRRIENNRFKLIIDPVIVRDASYSGEKQQLQASTKLISECLTTAAEDRPTMIDVAKRPRQIYLSLV